MPRLTLLTKRGKVHQAGCLNWGYSDVAHVRWYDAYIPIHIGTIRNNLDFFSNRGLANTVLTFVWDDGTTMCGLFEGTQINRQNELMYPKQISSHPHKDILGRYFRRRLGVPYDRRITIEDLERYGRTTVDITHIGENRYNFDFSV